MKLVVDTNVLFSFFNRKSTTREMISDFRAVDLFSPKFAFEELRKHSKIIQKKAKISEAEFEEIMEYLQTFVTPIPVEAYQDKLEEAEKVCPDPDDVDFFALAMKTESAIWSNEGDLKDQSRVEVFDTGELVKRFGF